MQLALSSGVNANSLILLNLVLAGTFGSLILLFWSSVSKHPELLPHVFVLLLLAVGLTISINWVVSQLGLTDPKDQHLFNVTDDDKKEEGDEKKEEEVNEGAQQSKGAEANNKAATVQGEITSADDSDDEQTGARQRRARRKA